MKANETEYHAAIYMRISKEDDDITIRNEKLQSNSIGNQKNLIKEYLKDKKDIKIYSEKVDDGYSGTDFNRPAFLEMMNEIKEGQINCIVVKDLSRFGRNYIEAGRFIERIFPVLGVRFIAINDNYDSLYEDENRDNLLIPFKNLINDAYSYDISIKIRSQLTVKRKNGQFTAAFAPYGYQKSIENKNQLIIDQNAASIIKEIFSFRLNGMSNQKIADKLNSLGVPSPLEYKNQMNTKFTTSFNKGFSSQWTSVAVNRILTNEVYIGTLQQGKVSTPSYKIKTQSKKDKKDWISVPNAHEAIINKDTFQIVNHLLSQSKRTSPQNNTEYLLSGILYCIDCKKIMIRKYVKQKQKDYCYYICSTYKNKKSCSSHTIQERPLTKTLSTTIQLFTSIFLTHNNFSFPFKQNSLIKNNTFKELYKQIRQKEQEITRQKTLQDSIYNDYKKGLLDEEDYYTVHDLYTKKQDDLKYHIQNLKEEYETRKEIISNNQSQLITLQNNHRIAYIDRKIVRYLIQKIYIIDKNRIEIIFSFQDFFLNR